MSTAVPVLERIAFFSGQPLGAVDLAALERRQRELRWLHNRSLHDWGIAAGFGVAGRRGDTWVEIEPGFGIDVLGREVLLGEPRRLSVPAVPSAPGGGDAVYYLVAAYVADAEQRVVAHRDGVCLPEGGVRLAEEPRLDWRTAAGVDDGRDLVLAKAWVRQCRLSRDLDENVRRHARPSRQPHVAAGKTPAGATPWTAWTSMGQMLGVQVTVSTAAARFRAAPRYLVEIEGERFLGASPGPLVAMGFPGLAETSAEGFTLRVALPKLAGPLLNPPALRKAATAPAIVRDRLGWRVAWAGIEGL